MKRYELTNTKPLAYEPDYRMVADEDGEYVLYDEAQARIEALEWLVEVQEFVVYFDPTSTLDNACVELAASWKYAELCAAIATEVKP